MEQNGFSENIGEHTNLRKMHLLKSLNTFRIFFFLIIAISLASCKSNFATLTIQNAHPSKEELPSDIQSLTIMNRSMSSQFQNYQEDSLQLYFYRNGYQLSKIGLDSLAADTTIQALAALLFESGRYDVVIPLERNIKRSISYELIPDTLNAQEVSEICQNFKTDALMVLEKFSTKIMADYSNEKFLDASSGYTQSYYATLDIKYDAFFRIYKPGNIAPVKEISLTDTIYWESSDNSQVRMFNKLPSIKKAMINAGIKVALDIDGKLSPSWISEKRGYFLLQSKNDPGQNFMNSDNYDEAANYWKEMTQSKNKKIRSKAEYNMALIGELNGDLDEAIEWGLKSYTSYYRFQTETYLKKLQARKESIKKTK